MRQRRLPESRAPLRALALIVLGTAASAGAPAPVSESLSAMQLLEPLRAGGCVLVMRHADAPFQAPDAREAEPDNPQRERQLDAQGKAHALALGEALRGLRVSIGPIYSSPAYRARETVRLSGLATPILVDALAEGAQGMASGAEAARTRWLERAVDRSPARGRNTLIVTHTPNIAGAFGAAAAHIAPAEMLVFKPVRRGRAHLLGRLTVADWKALAGER